MLVKTGPAFIPKLILDSTEHRKSSFAHFHFSPERNDDILHISVELLS